MSVGSAGNVRDTSRPSSYQQGLKQTSSQRSSSYEERCVDPAEPETQKLRTGQYKDANGKQSETTGFITYSAEPPSTSQTCNPCASPRACRTFMCSVLTCGLYRMCMRAPCLPPKQNTTEEPEKLSLRAENAVDKQEEEDDWLGDVCINGVKVDSPRDYIVTEDVIYVPQKQPCHLSLQECIRLDDWEDGEENVDSLITKKLLELYTEYQIEELARCTSDSVFLRKSKDINQLINTLAEEHQMDEQEAECRLVRGIIRISTRKSKKKKRPHVSRTERTLSDSGNETMRESSSFTFSNNNDYKSNPNIQISELTSSDKCARDMWRNNGGRTSSSSITYSPSHTETNSSGVPLIRTSVRT
ncbi:keratinocyte differentiation factor 1 [Dunckerocampus dactyliophorus]|uniref:keratinocyte differentiation factor 1 n=1 Tax=Dunckerocampus dactyliophorus TaxID=161453 RepID=UPI002405B3DF|nr:keratinocyte differentiation factor 1 [Dunckerocampus dactyliophorus]XP_054620455.1 keratinocyte differentiation factor 1 [Dunckerocampus dactyliophorus]